MTSLHPYDGPKRGLDIALSALLLAASAPIQGVVALLIGKKLGRPILFRQERPGRAGKPFTLVKFRTMSIPDPEHDRVADADRLTPFGSRLRSLSLDELPTLWNVLRGDMSLVGPRPLLTEYLPIYSPEQARRHEVRPGITGLAQVSGRNAVDWPERLRMDVYYVDHRSLFLDLRILLLTVRRVVSRDGISHPGHVTMPKFSGDHG